MEIPIQRVKIKIEITRGGLDLPDGRELTERRTRGLIGKLTDYNMGWH